MIRNLTTPQACDPSFARKAETRRQDCTFPLSSHASLLMQEPMRRRLVWLPASGADRFAGIAMRRLSLRMRQTTGWENAHLGDGMRDSLSRDPDPMTLWRCLVEHPCDTIKASMSGTDFLTRRLRGV